MLIALTFSFRFDILREIACFKIPGISYCKGCCAMVVVEDSSVLKSVQNLTSTALGPWSLDFVAVRPWNAYTRGNFESSTGIPYQLSYFATPPLTNPFRSPLSSQSLVRCTPCGQLPSNQSRLLFLLPRHSW